MSMRNNILVWLLILLMVPSLAWAGSEKKKDKNKNPQIPWQSYHGAMATAKSEDKPILLHFTADWCQWCKAMKRETYGDTGIARYLQENFACGWVDTEQMQALAKKYKINSLPTLWFLDSKGKALTSVDGYLGPEKMMRVLEFIETKAYEGMSYEKWKEKRLGRS